MQIMPTWRWMWRHAARIIALGFGSGLLRPGPGTWGTAAAWLSWPFLFGELTARSEWSVYANLYIGLILFICFLIGVWACNKTGEHLMAPDHSAMVWDEIVAFWLVLWLLPNDGFSQTLGFLIFRFFDILKPAPISIIDKKFKNGWGVMFDDVVAAFYTLLVFALATRLFS